MRMTWGVYVRPSPRVCSRLGRSYGSFSDLPAGSPWKNGEGFASYASQEKYLPVVK